MQAAEVTSYTSVFNYQGMLVYNDKIEIETLIRCYLNDFLLPILILIILLLAFPLRN